MYRFILFRQWAYSATRHCWVIQDIGTIFVCRLVGSMFIQDYMTFQYCFCKEPFRIYPESFNPSALLPFSRSEQCQICFICLNISQPLAPFSSLFITFVQCCIFLLSLSSHGYRIIVSSNFKLAICCKPAQFFRSTWTNHFFKLCRW